MIFALIFFRAVSDATAICGTGTKGYSPDGTKVTDSQINGPIGVGRGPDGLVYFCDTENHCIRRIGSDGTVSTVAGNHFKGYSGDGGVATAAALNQPYEIAWDRSGNLFFVEIGNHVVRRVDGRTHQISTIAGTGKPGFGGDGGPASRASFNQPHSLAFDPKGDLFVCDIGNHRVRKIDLNKNSITTWLGNGSRRTSPDGTSATDSSVFGPRAIAFGRDGAAWLALREGNQIIRVDPKTQTLERVVGSTNPASSGKASPALTIKLSGPKGIAVGQNGKVYFADTESHCIRVYDPLSKTVDLVFGDGQPTIRSLNRPHGVFIDRDGSILIGDTENHQIKRFQKQ